MEDTMETAIDKIDQKTGIVFVLKDNASLIGTITDGDIRRALSKGFDMKTSAIKIMNDNPKICTKVTSDKEIIELMNKHDVRQIPILNNERVVIDLKLLDEFKKMKKLENPVFIMAGGFGKRLRPLTDDIPKPLIKIGKKPILQLIIENLVSFGFKNFYISTHFMAEKVQKYFGDGAKWDISIEYIHEEKPLGTAGALGLLPNNLKLPLIMMNGDLLTNVHFKNLLKFHNEGNQDISMCVRKHDIQVPYGVVECDDFDVKKIQEKPVKSFFVNAGVYVLNPEVFENLKNNQHIDMPELIEKEILKQKNVKIFPMHEYWIDIGHIDNLKKAREELKKSNL